MKKKLKKKWRARERAKERERERERVGLPACQLEWEMLAGEGQTDDVCVLESSSRALAREPE